MQFFRPSLLRTWLAFAAMALCHLAHAGRKLEDLDRGLVVVKEGEGRNFVAWRLLGSDAPGTEFNLYRVTDGVAKRVNDAPLGGATQWGDDQAAGASAYFVRPVVGGKELQASAHARIWAAPFIDIPLQPLKGYGIGDASVGDLDGDGSYEIVVHRISQGRDNSFNGITGTPVLEAYRMDGQFLWRIDLGINIREGEHYTQFMVYDLDGDGCAELACKTADGSIDGKGKVIGEAGKDWRNQEKDSRRYGRILAGPEFFTIFDGKTGAALKTVDYIPSREPISGWGGIGGNGGNDNYGNRCDRFLACIAYLDGERPSVVMCRGVYGRTVAAAWDWRGGELRSRWVFDSGVSYPPFADASPYSGMGGHSISVADVDEDGKDEIVYQGMTIDDDGKGLYTTGRRHGDSMHVGDFDPQRPGMELYLITENEEDTAKLQTPGAGLHDARTGKLLWSHSPGVDIGSGMVADIDPRHPGAEVWGHRSQLRTIRGKEIGQSPRAGDWVIWWDGDLLREIYGGLMIFKWDCESGREKRIFAADAPYSASGRTRFLGRKPILAADLIGDWREEILLPGPLENSLRLYTTTHPTEHRFTTLMHDAQYRLSVAWQNVAYNKPPHPGFFLGEGMKMPESKKNALTLRDAVKPLTQGPQAQ